MKFTMVARLSGEEQSTTGNASTDLGVGLMTLIPFNPANDYYLIFAIQNSSTTPDNLGHKRVIVQIYD